MALLRKMSWLELKLFMREPLTVLFALALPLTSLFVMGGVFGNQVEEGYYGGVCAMSYYVPAYLALVAASVGLISMPTHIATSRELGVLKRYRASGISPWAVAGSQVTVMFVIATVSGLVLLAAAVPVLALLTLYRAWKKDFARHRAIAKWTWPIWMYVSVTGVVVYVMLYEM